MQCEVFSTGWQTQPPRRLREDQPKPSESEWDEREFILDPEDEKPADWDVSEYIPDPYASKPEDWNEDVDGLWEQAIIRNPEFKGEWSRKVIKNPRSMGAWIAEEIDNPDYKNDPDLYVIPEVGAVGMYCIYLRLIVECVDVHDADSICFLGIECWQETSGVLFDK